MLGNKYMKTNIKTLIFSFLSAIISFNCNAENILPLTWNISFRNNSCFTTRMAKQHSSINTLLSWERQGYFAGDGDCELTNIFNVSNLKSQYVLHVRMACDVKSIVINGDTIAKDIRNRFGENKDTIESFVIARKVLHKGNNKISISCSSLGYTGGVSNTLIVLRPVSGDNIESIKMSIPIKNHVFINENKKIAIHYHTNQKAFVRLHIENDFHKPIIDSLIAVSRKDSVKIINLNRLCASPGFYQITALLHGKGYCGDVKWMAVKPEQINCRNTVKDDFDDYWTMAKSELASISPQYRIHKVDSLCQKSKRDVYIVEMQSLGNITIRGYYFMPRTPGKHHAVLQVPGYGWGYENIDGMLSDNTDRIELALCVRGHGISADVFNPGFGLPGIWGYKLYDKDSVAYRGIYMDCVRAVDFLCSREEVDCHKIAVKGGSQGGGLTLATAALCSDRIAACAYFDPFPCDMRHQIMIRTICETELKNDLAYYGNACTFDEVMKIQDYIDTRSFASKIKCPVLFTAALFDDDCPVHVGFAAYNQIQSKKKYKIYPCDGHIQGFTHDNYIMNWLDETLTNQ
jgi:cephalosporin-C deacetylase-like acetyl esterase